MRGWRCMALCACLVAAGCGASTQSKGAQSAERGAVSPEAMRALTRGARALESGSRLSAAEQMLRQAVRLEPTLWEAHYDLGVALWRMGKQEDACASFRAAHDLASSAREPLFALAECEHARGNHVRAGELLGARVKDAPGDSEARLSYSVVLRSLGEHEAALDQARDVLIRSPRDVRALLEVARVYRVQGKLEVAALVLDKAEKLDPEAAEVALERGMLGLAQGDTQLAFDAFARASQLDPGLAVAHLNRGAVLLDAGDFHGAESSFRNALKAQPKSFDARLGLAVALRGKGAFKAAAEQYETLQKQRSDQPDVLFDLALLEADFRNRPKRAAALFERYLQVAPESTSHRDTARRYLEDIRMAASMGEGAASP